MRITRYAAAAAAAGILLAGCSSQAGNQAQKSADNTTAVESADPETFFTNPTSDRAKDFLSKILNH